MSTVFKFPQTEFVKCRFTLQTAREEEYDWGNNHGRPFDEYGRRVGPGKFKDYLYRLLPGGRVSVGDIVVVFCKTGYQVCEVSEIDVTVSDAVAKKLAYVVDVVDMKGFQEVIENEKRKEVLKVQIESMKKELEATQMYSLLAEKNPEFAELLKAFQDLGGKLS